MTASAIRTLPTDRILPNPSQHRRHFDEAALQELALSIAERGVLQNLLVRRHPDKAGMYQLIAGERRFRAAKIAGVGRIPCRVIEADEGDAFRMSMVENVQRADISPLEEADGYATLRDRFGMAARDIAQAVGKSDQYVNHKLQLTRLCRAVRQFVDNGMLSALGGYFIARLEQPEQQTRVATLAVQRQLTQHEINRMVNVLLGKEEQPPQAAMLEVEALTSSEQDRRNRFQRALGKVTEMLWATWDTELQRVNTKVVRNVVETDLEKVRNLRQWLGQVESALSTELQRRNLVAT